MSTPSDLSPDGTFAPLANVFRSGHRQIYAEVVMSNARTATMVALS